MIARLALCGFCLVTTAAAQSPAPPGILEIHRERLKPGAIAEYRNLESRAAQACRDAPCPNPYLAMRSLAGPEEVWFLNGFDTYEILERVWSVGLPGEVENLQQEKADLVEDSQRILLRYRENLSHDAGTPLARMRYIAVETVFVRPGSSDEYEQARRLARGVHDRMKSPESRLVYEAFSGTASGTFYVLTPMRSAAEWERVRGRGPADPGVRAKIQERVRTSVGASETALFTFSPTMSYVTEDWAGADPEFWRPGR
jgi:hypothetical protein